MNVEISEVERDVLLEVLEMRREELYSEVRRSMDHDYKDMLKVKLNCCEELLSRLKDGGAT